MSFQVCDICDNFSGLLVNFYGRWTCQECVSIYSTEHDSCYDHEWMVVPKPTKMLVTIEEIFCDAEDLASNTKFINYSPDWEKRKFGPCKVSVEFFED